MKRSLSLGRRTAVLLIGLVLGCGSVSETPSDGGGGAGGGGGAAGSAGGALGTAGTTGTGGALGAAGTSGAAGTTGSAGTTGTAGAIQTGGAVGTGGGGAGRGGTTGAAGTTGVAGTTGTGGGGAGRGGTTGVAGTTGTGGGNAGRGGTTGAAGTTGVAGTTGAAGTGGVAGTGGTGGTPGVCTPGTAMCVGLTPQLCNSQGQWQSGAPCPFLCSGGFCTGTCVPNTRRCGSTGLPQLCSAAGAWVDQSPCPFVCTGSGVCGGQCVPNSMRCQGGQNQTCDANGSWQNTSTSVLQLLQNPNFDLGAVSWTEIGGLPGYPLITTLDGLPFAAHTGQYVLWEGGYDDAEDDAYQTLTIPTGATAITLSFSYQIRTEEIDYAYDGMAAYISDAGTNILNPLVELTNLDQTTVWTRSTVPVPLTWAGRRVEVGFLTLGDGSYITSFFVDTVSLTATACPVAGGTGSF